MHVQIIDHKTNKWYSVFLSQLSKHVTAQNINIQKHEDN